MVHALEEVARVLISGGTLIDLRPIAADWPVEVMVEGRPQLAGFIDTTRKIPDDAASSRAIAAVLKRGLFQKEAEETFDYAYYWDRTENLIAYVAEKWNHSSVLPEPVAGEAERLLDSSPSGSKIRVQRRLLIARYRKAGEG